MSITKKNNNNHIIFIIFIMSDPPVKGEIIVSNGSRKVTTIPISGDGFTIH